MPSASNNGNCSICRKAKNNCRCIPGTLYAPGGISDSNWDRNAPCFEQDDKLGAYKAPNKFACANCKRMIEKKPCGFCRR